MVYFVTGDDDDSDNNYDDNYNNNNKITLTIVIHCRDYLFQTIHNRTYKLTRLLKLSIDKTCHKVRSNNYRADYEQAVVNWTPLQMETPEQLVIQFIKSSRLR